MVLRIVWQPWRHFVTWVKGRQEHHIRTLPLPAPASWGPVSVVDPFVSWADKHSTVPAAVHCLSLSEEQLMELDTRWEVAGNRAERERERARERERESAREPVQAANCIIEERTQTCEISPMRGICLDICDIAHCAEIRGWSPEGKPFKTNALTLSCASLRMANQVLTFCGGWE